MMRQVQDDACQVAGSIVGVSETDTARLRSGRPLGREAEGVEDPNVLAVSHHLLTIFESASEIAASRSVAAC
jgi:hypothetical protein